MEQKPIWDFADGEIIGIDKPRGMSSFLALAIVRGHLSRRLGVKRLKVGHAGTLDPMATGVLVLCTGRATKRIEELQRHGKQYTATLQLGATTASYDMEHPVDARFPTDHITREAVEAVLPRFCGDIMQTPPAYSACKIDGKRAYEIKRTGDEPALQPKPVRVDAITLTAYDDAAKQATITVDCGKGTYIRSLARDIGQALGCGAYLTALRRTRSGSITAEDCLTVEQFPEWLGKLKVKS